MKLVERSEKGYTKSANLILQKKEKKEFESKLGFFFFWFFAEIEKNIIQERIPKI